MTSYTVVRVLRDEYKEWLSRACKDTLKANATQFHSSGSYEAYNQYPVVTWVCLKGGEPVGFLFASYGVSVLDSKTRVLRQDVLYAPEGFRTTKYLYDAFIDFGRKHADHIITMIAPNTDIKPRSLERMGFKYMETLYRMEVK